MAKAHISLRGLKKRKRGDNRVYRFVSFCRPGDPTHLCGSFQENLSTLLEFGEEEEVIGCEAGFKCWSFLLQIQHCPTKDVKLFVVEETLAPPPLRQCHYCRSVGWGSHMICWKRIHFVLPNSKESGNGEANESFSIELNGASESDKPTVGPMLKIMEVENHPMHGILHSNGFGHLICVNGFEGGSNLVSGHQIMSFWDRICTTLQARQVSLIDVARKGAMELRLIHGLAYGEPWFQRWGYRFGHGSFGITEDMHRRSLQALRACPLTLLIPPLCCVIFDREVLALPTKYQSISGKSMKTMGELFYWMMELRARLPHEKRQPANMDFRSVIASAGSCRWSMKRVEMAAQAIVQALKRAEHCWITRQDVRDAARAYIGDTGLLDFVLKSLGNHSIGNYIVRRMVNPVTKVLEYSLQDISTTPCSYNNRPNLTKQELNKDMLHLYKHIRFLSMASVRGIKSGQYSTHIARSLNVLLDTKHLIKDYFPSLFAFACDNSTYHNDIVIGPENNGREVSVDCLCGAKVEDGERMVRCDICEVWQHTRCVGIQSGDEVPCVFLCKLCEPECEVAGKLDAVLNF